MGNVLHGSVGNYIIHQGASKPVHKLSASETNWDSSLNTSSHMFMFCQSVAFHITLAWYHSSWSHWYFGVEGSARRALWLQIHLHLIVLWKESLWDQKMLAAWSFHLIIFLVTPDPVYQMWVPSYIYCSQNVLTAHSKQLTLQATYHIDQFAVFMPMMRPFSTPLNWEKCLLTCLSGILYFLKSP